MTEITDWDDAYANAPYIQDGASYPKRWAEQAAAFRAGHPDAELDQPYGDQPRQRFDLFHPAGPCKGLFIFVHGGYWLRFNKSDWSHLAQGALANGWAAALPGYTLAPEASITAITAEITTAINQIAARWNGPIALAGHSAGGHLVTRVTCTDTKLEPQTAARIAHVASISGLHDLAPLRNTKMNDSWRMSKTEAAEQSPALHQPLPHTEYMIWVGAAERPEFLRQSRLLAEKWRLCSPRITCREIDKMHHFNVIENLAQPHSELVRWLVAEV